MSTLLNEEQAATTDQLQATWKTRILRARDARKQFEPIWLSNLAFAAGQHWLVWDDQALMMRHLRDLDPRAATKNLLTADRINEYRQAQLGELETDDDLPALLAVQDGHTAETVVKELNSAVGYAWEHEWRAADALSRARQYAVDLGTAAVRCKRDPNHGDVVDHLPLDQRGQPITDESHPDYQSLAETGQLSDGSLPKIKPVREGRTILQPYTSFGILAPPGFNHENEFPWEILVDVVTVEDAEAEYGVKVTEDTDIASTSGLSTGQTVRDTRSQANSTGRVRGSVWRYLCFQRPSPKYPQGMKVTLLSNAYTVVDVQESLDYQLPNGDWHSGVVYFHWWRLIDRFYSRAFIEPLKDPQREINNLETMKSEIVSKGMPKVIVQKPIPEKPQGIPMEEVVVGDQGATPILHPGIGPGPWMDTEKAGWVDNMTHASTLSQVRLGENPSPIDTYAQLALVNENESSKRFVIRRDHQRQIATLVELGVWDIRKYWPEEKQILVSGEDDQISREVFQKATIPDFYMAKVPTGAPLPRSQAADLKMLDAIWAAAVQSWVAVNDGATWVGWYADSIKAGKPLDLPEPPTDSQTQMAEYENMLMRHGEQVIPADYDLLPVHLPKHREAQDQARAVGDMELFLRIQQHIDASVKVQQENAAKVAQMQQQPSPQGPGGGGVDYMQPIAREPQPQMIAHAFGRLSQGQ